MVARRNSEEDSEGKSVQDSSSDTSEEDLDYLIDSVLGNLSVYPSNTKVMTIKNRKERSKHDRSEKPSNVESTASPQNESHTFGVRRHTSGSRGQTSSRIRNRQNRGHASSTVMRQNRYAFAQYATAADSRLSPTSVNRHWSNSNEPTKNIRDRLVECSEVTDLGTGNNSEDEYGRVSENTSPNSSKLEDNALDQILKEKKGWKVVRVHGDGACLFRSVSHQVFGDEEKHDIIRKQVVDYMCKNREHFSQYVTEDFDRYLHRKRQPNCFGNHLEIQAISELYNRPVEIYYNNVVPINVFHAEYSHDVPIRLGYYGRTHYNSIIDPCKPSFGHGLGMPNYQPGLPEKDLVKQAIRESETSELEEAMLRDKLAESENKQLEDCIAEHVLRESLYEHMKARLDGQAAERQRVASPPQSVSPGLRESTPPPLSTSNLVPSSTSASQVPCSSSCSSALPSSSTSIKPSSSNTVVDVPGSAATLTAAAASVAAASASSDPAASDFAVLRYIPANMLDMSDDDVLAMVLEQSRSEYIEGLRAAYRGEDDDFEERGRPTAQSYFRQNLEPSQPSAALSKDYSSGSGGCGGSDDPNRDVRS
uniref:ubiquitinyl hydrolase 1 n=1 Tax=Echinococcus granulosus TaxID=6210 RepID=A0A068WZP3_ECHGR|nr:OTU domain containing protein 5 A [Echinococcus granulosus]